MIKSVTQHSYFEKKPNKQMGRNSPSIGWVHPKSTHACPLAWGNKNQCKRYGAYVCCDTLFKNEFTHNF